MLCDERLVISWQSPDGAVEAGLRRGSQEKAQPQPAGPSTVDLAETVGWLPALSTTAPHGAKSDQARTQKQHAGRLGNVCRATAGIYTAGKPSRATDDICAEDLTLRICGEACKRQSAGSNSKGKAAPIRRAAAIADSFKSVREGPHPIHHQAAGTLRVATRDGEVS
jgi:hypothetical protein